MSWVKGCVCSREYQDLIGLVTCVDIEVYRLNIELLLVELRRRVARLAALLYILVEYVPQRRLIHRGSLGKDRIYPSEGSNRRMLNR